MYIVLAIDLTCAYEFSVLLYDCSCLGDPIYESASIHATFVTVAADSHEDMYGRGDPHQHCVPSIIRLLQADSHERCHRTY